MSNPPNPPRRRRIAGEPAPRATPPTRKPLRVPRPKPVTTPTKPVTAPKTPKERSKGNEARTNKTGLSLGSAKLPPKQSWKWLGPLVALTIAALVFGGVVGVPGVLEAKCRQSVADPNPNPAAKAGEAAQVIFTFRYDKLEDHLKDSKALMTPKFQEEFDKIAPALTALAPQRKVVVQAETRSAATLAPGSECKPAKANVLVFVDQARVTDKDKDATVFANRIVMHMVKDEGAWLVDDIDAL